MDLKSKIVLIYGPTASGKSNFAIKLAKKITKSQSKTVLLHPYSEKTLLNKEKSLFTSITGIDCSWALAEQVFQKDF